MAQVFLGIDVGTGSSKGVVTDAEGEVLATATRPRPESMSLPRPGWAEMDADRVWWDDVVALCRELVPASAGHHLAGICVSGVGPCLLLTDASGRPLRPAILYGIDMRAGAEISELTARYGADEIVARGGTALSTQAVGPKALWVQRNEPEVWSRTRRWFNSHSYLAYRLTGEYVLDHHTASQSDPLYDIQARTWHDPWVDDIMRGVDMPRLVWPAEIIGTVTADAAEQTGLPAGTPVSAGTVDAWAEAFSAGVRRPGDLMLMYGSTMFFVKQTARPERLPLLWTTVGVAPGTYSLAAGMATSGSLTSWFQTLTGSVPFDQLVSEAADVSAGSDGLLLLPYFAGERTPVFDARARGVIAGLTLTHTRGHLFRAIYEGIAFGIRQILTLLDVPASPVERIVAVGGGTKGRLWTQIVSDVTRREQHVPTQTIGASYGDALLAAIATRTVPAETDWARVRETVQPDTSHAETYEQLFDDYEALYPSTRAVVHHLAALQENAPGRSRAQNPP